jgi:hypothetical protein
MNLVLDKLGKTDIQLLKTLRLLNIGMLYEVRPIGRYYIFGPVTCNALFWSGYASIGRITLVEWRDFIRTKPICSTKFTLDAI